MAYQDRIFVRSVMKTKNPAKIMAFGLVCSNGKGMPAHVFPPNFRLNIAIFPLTPEIANSIFESRN